MSKEAEYRKNAAQSVELAHRTVSSADKGRMLRLAEAWLDLADRAHRVSKDQRAKGREHPLISATYKQSDASE
jgi:hypothetical protein